MKLVVANETSDAIYLRFESSTANRSSVDDDLEGLIVPPYTSMTTVAPGLCTPVKLNALTSKESHGYIASSASTTFPLKLGAKWKAIPLPPDCPWRIYRSQVSDGVHRLSVFPRRNLAAFLSQMPESMPLSSLLLPGTHDSMAFYGWPFSQCQSPSTPLAVQLRSGIRVLDVRLAVVKGVLISYHSFYPQRMPFQDIIRTIRDFFAAPEGARETVVMSIKQEDFKKTPLSLFSRCVHDELIDGPGGRDLWFLENRIPTLGEVRGKIVMLSRFGGDGTGWENGLEGLGIHPTAWPDSEKAGFTWELKGTLVRTHDWYSIPSFLSIPEKVKLSTAILTSPPYDPAHPVLNITYFSASSFPFAAPPTVSRGFGWPKAGLGVEGVNGRVGRWLLDQLSGSSDALKAVSDVGGLEKVVETEDEDVRIRGWTMMDYYSEPENMVVPLLVECNFRGRQEGEEGWLVAS